MRKKNDSKPIGEIACLGQELLDWRSKHKKRSRLPEELWEKAAALAAQHGVKIVGRALRLDGRCLKRRIAARTEIQTQMPTFVELLPSVAPMEAPVIGECALEVESRHGSRLRIVLKDVAPFGLASIIRDFAR
jgi:hypothetical protein